MSITFGNVPHPEMLIRPISKPDGFGQNYLGRRAVKGVVWHRMLGSLWGTDTHFRIPSVGALTDYGVGVLAQDGAANDGLIIRWNDPRGDQSGWASGSYSAAHAYGDGAAFVRKYGINAINRDQASIEISGHQNTPLSEASRNAIAAVTAYWADQYGIPWDVFPIAPQDGFSFVRWHEEFGPDNGTKKCPFDIVKRETPALIERTRQIMKRYQTEFAPEPTPEPEPEKPKYAVPNVPDFLVDDNGLKVEYINKTPTYPVGLVFTAIRDTPRRQGADPNTAEVGPVLKEGTRFRSTRVFRSRDKTWVLTKNGSRIAATDLKPTVTVSVDGYVGVKF